MVAGEIRTATTLCSNELGMYSSSTAAPAIASSAPRRPNDKPILVVHFHVQQPSMHSSICRHVRSGTTANTRAAASVCVCLAGQQRLQVDYQGLTDRVVKAEKLHTSFASQLQQSGSSQNQLKASLRSAQRQAGAVEAGQAKLQQEVADLGQAVEQVKGRKGPAQPWQRSQEQVCKHLECVLCVAGGIKVVDRFVER